MVARAPADGAASVTIIEIAAVDANTNLHYHLYVRMRVCMYLLQAKPLPAQITKKTNMAMLNDQDPSRPRLAMTFSRGAQMVVRGQPHMTMR